MNRPGNGRTIALIQYNMPAAQSSTIGRQPVKCAVLLAEVLSQTPAESPAMIPLAVSDLTEVSGIVDLHI